MEAPVEPAVNLDFFFQLDDCIRAKRRKVSAGMLRTYNVIKERPLAFQKYRKEKITFDSFDFNFYENLVNYLTYEHIHLRRQITLRGLKRNSVGTTNEELNRHIKKVGQLAGINTPIKASYKMGNQDIVTTKPKYAWITTHTCRRSFCTNESWPALRRNSS